MNNRLPVTIITGFLGSGKTTLLRKLLTNSGRKLAVIVNEFGDVGIDGDLINCDLCPKNETEGRLIELKNGCLCCTVQEDFVPTMQSLISDKTLIEGIIIETSGLALPRPLLQALSWPEIRTKVFVSGVVTVVDGEAMSNGSPVGNLAAFEKQRIEDKNIDHESTINELFNDQINVADLILISKKDKISKLSIEKVKNQLIKKIDKYVPIFNMENGLIDSSVILGINSEKHLEDSYSDLDHAHSHLKVFSDSIKLECYFDLNSLKSFLKEIAREFGTIRVKGRIWIPNKSTPLQLQMVGERLDCWYENSNINTWRPKTSGLELVFISFRRGTIESLEKYLRNQ